ncbi:MAG: class I SAM-dependent methyltransferase family protein [Candidatus Aenigmatarchaeota archaeon]
MKEKLSKRELEKLKTSFDLVGDVAILEEVEGLKKYDKQLAEAVMKVNKHVQTVCKKLGEREGELRLRKIKVIKSKRVRKKTETIHKEFGCSFFLDVKKTYFSPRESTERQRILDQVKHGETILVMFSGIAPFSIIIAKKKNVKVYSIELNKDACKYAVKNVELNKVQDKVEVICGDVKKETKRFYRKCNRVLMPLPKDAYKFLPEAIKAVKQSGVIHLYHVSPEEDLFTEPVKLIKEEANKLKRKVRILNKRKVLAYGPRTWKVCIDFEVQ